MASNVTLPDGFVLDQPEQSGAGSATLPQGFQLDTAAPPSTAQDIKTGAEKGAAQGLGRALSYAGLPSFGLASALVKGGQMLGLVPNNRPLPSNPAQMVNEATGANALPDPQGMAGQAAQTAAGTAVDPLSYVGPGGMIRSGLSSLGAAGASEGAGDLAHAMGASPAVEQGVRTGVGLMSPTFGGAKGNLPSTAEIKAAGSAKIDQFRNSGLELDGPLIGNQADIFRQQLQQSFTPFDAPATHGVLEQLAGAKPGSTVSANNIKNINTQLGNISNDPMRFGKADALAARQARTWFNNTVENVPPNGIVAGNPGDLDLLRQGNANYAAASQASRLDAMTKAASTSATGENSGLNAGNRIAQKFNSYFGASTANNPNLGQQRMNAYANYPGAQSAIQNVTPSMGRNIIRLGGNMLGGGGGIGSMLAGGIGGGLLAGGAAAFGGANAGESLGIEPVGSALTMGTGLLLRHKYNSMQRAAAQNASEVVRAGSPLAQATGQTMTTQQAQRALLLRRALNATQAGQQQ